MICELLANRVPHFARDGVDVLVRDDAFEVVLNFARVEVLRTVCVHQSQEAPLAGYTGHVQTPDVPIPTLWNPVSARHNAQSKQQMPHVIGELPTRGRVVDAPLPSFRVPLDAAIRRPEVLQEQRHLVVGSRENRCWYEFLVTAFAEQSEAIQPRADAIAFTVRQPERCGESQRRDTRSLVHVTHGRHPKMCCGRCNRRRFCSSMLAYRTG